MVQAPGEAYLVPRIWRNVIGSADCDVWQLDQYSTCRSANIRVNDDGSSETLMSSQRQR